MIDYATRYPEAVALPSIETERVAEALMAMFSRVGIPSEMLIEHGSHEWSKQIVITSEIDNYSVPTEQ